MAFQRTVLMSIKFILGSSLLFPFVAFAHLMTITPTNPLPSTVNIGSTIVGTYTIKNTTSKTILTAVDQTHFTAASGLSILPSSTCGAPMKPGETCNLYVQLQAFYTPQIISTMRLISGSIKVWDKPSVDAENYPIRVSILLTKLNVP